MSENCTHPFTDDRPILSVAEDKLDRGKFVKQFSKSISGWKGKDSIVIAIYGDWGAGKTSIKNMIIEEIKEQKQSPLVMDFNPWQRAGKFDLLEIFFRELSMLLGNVDYQNKYADLAKKVKKYGRIFSAGKSLYTIIKKVTLIIFLLLAALSFYFSWSSGGIFHDAYFWGGAISLLVFAVLAYFEGLFKNIYSVFDELSEINKKGLNETKKELANDLKKIEQPILVVLDDVDRLSPDEVKTVLQLVKANGDFPNIIYLMLFQRDVLEKAIGEYSRQDGREFLKKIVQIGFNIPEIDRVKLESILFERLNDMLITPSINSKFKEDRWRELFIPGLRPYFNNMRDVNRFIGTLHFHVECFKTEQSFEVNPVDLIAIEVLRVFEPDVYKSISISKQYLTEKYSDKEKDEYKKIFDGIVSAGSKDRKNSLEKILSVLFFNVSKTYEGDFFDGSTETAFKDSRISHPDVFDRYFYFKTPEGDVSNSEIEIILSAASDRNKLLEILTYHKQKGQLRTLLDRINNYVNDVSMVCAEPFITALFDIGDNLPEEEAFMHGEKSYISIIFRNYLLREPDAAKRCDVFIKCIKNTTGLYIPFYLVHSEDCRHDSKKSPDRYLVLDDNLQILKDACIEKIQILSDPNIILENRDCFYLLFLWDKWCDCNKAKEFAMVNSDDNHKFVRIMRSACRTVTSSSGNEVTRRLAIDLRYLEKLYNTEYLLEKVNAINIEELDEDGKNGIKTLRIALERRKAGKSDDGFFDDE